MLLVPVGLTGAYKRGRDEEEEEENNKKMKYQENERKRGSEEEEEGSKRARIQEEEQESDWREEFAPTGKRHYWNVKTRESRWEKPADA